MKNKVIILGLFAVLFGPCFPSEAQQPGKVPRIAVLSPGSVAFTLNRDDSLRQGLRELGYVEGKNILIEIRYAEGKPDRLSDLATELVKLKVDVIVTATTPGVLAVKKATSTIPIVFAGAGDPVKAGLVSSLAHPGENITGLSILNPELDGKRLELLKEAFPKITRVAHIWDPTGGGGGLADVQAAAPALRLQVLSLEVRDAKDFDSTFATILTKRAQAITVGANPIISIADRGLRGEEPAASYLSIRRVYRRGWSNVLRSEFFRLIPARSHLCG